MSDTLFAGLDEDELPEATRAAIKRNFEAMTSSCLLRAAEMTLDSDVVLVARSADGDAEEQVRASSEVLRRVSTAFSGILEETDGRTIKIWRPGSEPRQLQPIGSVRFVLSIVHAVAAAPEGLNADSTTPANSSPPIDILLSACQIADCWDLCDAVLPAVARCLAAASEDAAKLSLRGLASSLVRMIRLVPAGPISPVWIEVRDAAEEALACHLPLQWLPGALKSFDLEGASRVINRIGSTKVVLSMTLPGATALEPAWFAREPASHGGTIYSDEVPLMVGEGPLLFGHLAGGEKMARLRCKFQLEVRACEPEADDTLATLEGSVSHLPEDNELRVQVRTVIEDRRAKQMAVYIVNTGHGTALVDGDTTLRVIPDGKSRMEPGATQVASPVVRSFTVAQSMGPTESSGWDSLGNIKSLGGCRVEATVIISKLQSQFEVLARWFEVKGRPRCAGPSSIVGTLQRLQLDSGCFTSKVHLRLGTEQFQYDHQKHRVGTLLLPKMEPTLLWIRRNSAASQLCRSMMDYMMQRLDECNGPVNRAAALLDRATVVRLLRRREYESIHGLSCEKELLRIAVDWSAQPWREPADMKKVLKQIYWAGVPTRTLLHHDEGSGWIPVGASKTHTLRDRLKYLATWEHPNAGSIQQYNGFVHEDYSMEFVTEFMTAALTAQRERTHVDALPEVVEDSDVDPSGEVSGVDIESLRPCFAKDPPEFPSSSVLLDMMLDIQRLDAARSRSAVEERLGPLQKRVESLDAENTELRAEVERLKQGARVLVSAAVDPMDAHESTRNGASVDPPGEDAARAPPPAKRPRPDEKMEID